MLLCIRTFHEGRLGPREHPLLSKIRSYYDGSHKGIKKVHSERRTANPITITFAGGNTCQMNKYERVDLGPSSCSEAYRADTFSKCL
jgi:hypothetical protein